jgi:hypothetical protein
MPWAELDWSWLFRGIYRGRGEGDSRVARNLNDAAALAGQLTWLRRGVRLPVTGISKFPRSESSMHRLRFALLLLQ